MVQVLHRGSGDLPPVALIVGGDDGEAPARQPAPVGEEARRCDVEGLRVLVVEDEALISLELEEMFETLGLEVVGMARSADEAVRMAAATMPDFLTMDVNLLGERDGVSAATEIYERFGLRSLFVTAYGDARTAVRAQPVRPLGWLAKPVTRRELAEALPVLLADLDEK